MHWFDVGVGHLFSYPKIPGVLLFYDFLTDGFSLFFNEKSKLQERWESSRTIEEEAKCTLPTPGLRLHNYPFKRNGVLQF